jgi:hypothetical protein
MQRAEYAPICTPSEQFCILVVDIWLGSVNRGVVNVERGVSFLVLQIDVDVGTLQEKATRAALASE